ncbi:MAG: selenide, water dikinase SelD [Anaerolineales bacterium]|nr:selenide, water dikinase SelD [Anaerolineales bacterium]
MSVEPTLKLTSLAACAGCAAKLGPAALAQVLQPLAGQFTPADYPHLIVGLAQPDDAAVYRLSPDQAIIATADFFPPVVDDAYTYGAIVAANALSDIYAMGGRPIFALNLAAFPEDMPAGVISAILRGGADKVREAGAAIAGGHTITDSEPKYGLAVTGLVHPDRLFTKGGARPGDRLIFTKRLGTGVIITAAKGGHAAPADLAEAIAGMVHLNRRASEAAQAVTGVRAVTDVTGFGLLGHAHEMAHLADVAFILEYAALPWLPGARPYAEAGHFPGGAERNQRFYSKWARPAPALGLTPWQERQLYDPQTSGGLLIAVAAAHLPELVERLHAAGEPAYIIGAVETGHGEVWVR